MQVTESKSDGLKREFKIVVPAAQMKEKVDARLAEIKHSIRLPGFRPGKIPAGLLKKKYGTAALHEVVEQLINEGVRRAIEESKIRPAMQPNIKVGDVNEEADLSFEVMMEALPEFTITDLSAISLERMVVPVADAILDQRLAGIAERFGDAEPLPEDHVAENGDITEIDFLGKVDDAPFEGGKGEDYRLPLGSNSFIPGFEDQLIGVKAGEERAIKVTFPAEYHAAELAGKDAVFDVKVKALLRQKPAALDDDLATKLGFKTIAEIRDMIRSGIEGEYQKLSRSHVKRALLDKLSDLHDFAVPEGMVDFEFNAIWEQIEKAKAENRLDPEDMEKSEETLRADYHTIAERRVRLGLVVAEVGRLNNITVTQEDLSKAMMEEARRYPGQEHMVLQFFQNNPQAAENLRAPVFEEKVVDFMLEMVKISEKEVTEEELLRDPDAAPAEAK